MLRRRMSVGQCIQRTKPTNSKTKVWTWTWFVFLRRGCMGLC